MQAEKCLTFLLGPAHSGKSAEAIALAGTNLDTLVIGMANLQHPLMQSRVEALKSSRPAHWQHVDQPGDLPAFVFAAAQAHEQIVIDSLNLWLATLTVQWQSGHGARSVIDLAQLLNAECDRMVDALVRSREAAGGTRLIVVGAEMGASPSPPVETERAFREANGKLNRATAAIADRVILMTAGIPTVLRSNVLNQSHIGG